jgi:hypothetical protein
MKLFDYIFYLYYQGCLYLFRLLQYFIGFTLSQGKIINYILIETKILKAGRYNIHLNHYHP